MMKQKNLRSLNFIFSVLLSATVSQAQSEHDHSGHPMPMQKQPDSGMGGHSMPMGPKQGKYIGAIDFSQSKRSFLVSLDLYVTQNDDDYRRLRGHLKIFLGSFGTSEYISFHFEEVHYGFQNKSKLVFDNAELDITLSNAVGHGDMIMAKVRSSVFSESGKLNIYLLKKGKKVKPKFPIVDTLSGDYAGSCDGSSRVLQIVTARTLEETAILTNPFQSYQIQAQLVDTDQGANKMVTGIFTAGAYNFYSGELSLYGLPENLKCKVNKADLNCSSNCTFKKLNSNIGKENIFIKTARAFSILDDFTEPLPKFAEPTDLEGVYSGYLHHELLDVYQPFQLNIVSYKFATMSMSAERTYISGVTTLFFNDLDSPEFVSYKFERRPYVTSFPYMLLGGELDGSIQITEWTKSSIKGIWHSRIFGPVGGVELLKGNALAHLPKGETLMPGISGHYQRGDRFLTLMNMPAESIDSRAHSPYFPLSINGVTYIEGVTKALDIHEGVYDFYTGSISFTDETDRLIRGQVKTSGLSLFFPAVSEFGATYKPQSLSVFERGKQ